MTRFLWIFALLLCSVTALPADEVDVYLGETAVSGQDRAERDRMLPAALENALSRYSGLRDFSGIENFEDMLNNASAMLVTFYYRKANIMQADGEPLEQSRLVARFSPGEVDALARSLALPLWPPSRNELEVWVVVDDGRAREVLPLELAYVRDVLDDVARGRGQPLTWPVPDQDGMYPVDMQLLWGGYTEDLSSATGTGVLILAARREGVEWNVRANLGFGGDHRAWRVRALSLEPALVEALHKAVDQVAEIRSIRASDLGAQRHRLTVEGLDSAESYEACLSSLQGITIVEGVTVVAARPAAFTFELALTALPRYLEQTIAADDLLQAGEKMNHYVFSGEK
jgi:hypothetical protein